MNGMYQRTKLAGEEADVSQILGILSDIKNGRLKNDLKLLNFFRQMPVSYDSTVLTIEEQDAELEVSQVQAVVISLDKMTVLKSSHFPSDVLASANYVKVEKSRVVLSNFSYAVVRAERRMSVRVELTEPILASFTHASGSAAGRLQDISLSGVAIHVKGNPHIAPSEKGRLSVTLPIGTITVPASLLKVVTTEDGHRLVFQIEASRDTELNISQYIMRRQMEIIKELKTHPGITSY